MRVLYIYLVCCSLALPVGVRPCPLSCCYTDAAVLMLMAHYSFQLGAVDKGKGPHQTGVWLRNTMHQTHICVVCIIISTSACIRGTAEQE